MPAAALAAKDESQRTPAKMKSAKKRKLQQQKEEQKPADKPLEDDDEDSGLEMASEKHSVEEDSDTGEELQEKKAKKEDDLKDTVEADKDKVRASSASAKASREAMSAEIAFAVDVMRLMVVPKHKKEGDDPDSDDDDQGFNSLSAEQKQQLFGTKGNRVNSLQELHQRFRDKMTDLKGNRVDGRKKKGKLSKVEKKRMSREAKKKLATAGKIHLQQQSQIAERKNKKGGAGHQQKKVYNEEGKMVFSKFDFTAPDESKDGAKQKVDPKSALAKLKAHKEKIKSLEKIGKTERVKNLESKTAWKTALDKAEGVKVKDDAGLLKKSIKRIDQRKKSTKKKWADREEGVEKRKTFTQDKRAENIKKRKDGVKKTKDKKMAKRGRTVPGFK